MMVHVRRPTRIALALASITLGALSGVAWGQDAEGGRTATPTPEQPAPPSSAGPAEPEAEIEAEAMPAAEAKSEQEAAPEAAPKRSGQDDDAGDADSKAIKRAPKVIDIKSTPEGTIYWITVDEVIELGLAPYIERVVKEANADEDAVAIVSEIHTPGGRVDAAVRIRDALIHSELPTVAFIHSEAISAGALIALAHDYIVMVPGGTIGAATPIQMGGGGDAQPVGEKVTSYVRGVFRATAEAKDRDPVVAEAMVDAEIHIPGLAPKGKLLTATATQALEWGIADLFVESEVEMLKKAGLDGPRIERRGPNWAEAIARVLTHPMISGMLMSFGFLGLLMEFYSPGFGVIGGIGLTLLLLFFFGHYVVHLAGLEEVALFGIGVLLLLAEVFFIPGFGVAGIAGIGAIVASLVMALIANPIDVSIDTGELADALTRVLLSLVITAGLGLLIVTRLAKSGPFQRLVLAEEIGGRAVGFGADAAGGTRPATAGADDPPEDGAFGTARTPLRPSGKVLIAGRTFDAISAGEPIEIGDRVVVRGTRGANLIVRAAPVAPPDAEEPAVGS